MTTDAYACSWVAIGRDWCPAEALDPVPVLFDARVVELWCCPEHAALLRYAARREVDVTAYPADAPGCGCPDRYSASPAWPAAFAAHSNGRPCAGPCRRDDVRRGMWWVPEVGHLCAECFRVLSDAEDDARGVTS